MRETFSVKAVAFIAGTAFVAWGLALIALPLADAGAQGISPFDALCRAIGLTSTQVPTTGAGEARGSNLVLNAALLRHIAGGSAERGAKIAEDVCWSCHLANGETSDPTVQPTINGQSAKAIYKQLWDLRTGARVSETMKPIAEQLDEGQMADVAAYFAALPRRNEANPEATVVEPATVNLVLHGDPARSLPPCAACHETRAGGPAETPLLVGQYPVYVAAQLKAYAEGARKNDHYARMRSIARKLTPEEIEDLSVYYNAPLAVH